MRLIDADDLKRELEVTQYNDIDDLTRTEKLIDNAPTVDVMSFTNIICNDCKYADVLRDRKPCCSCKWLKRKSYYEGIDDV